MELIASALEIGIARWDHDRHALCKDIAIRIAAFERLYRIRVGDDQLTALVSALDRCDAGSGAEVVAQAVEEARREVVAHSSSSEGGEAILTEIVIVGRCSKDAAMTESSCSRALPLGRAALLARAELFSEALVVCEAILDRVPGHTLALRQAARCCVECGALLKARVYAKRAFGGVNNRDVIRKARSGRNAFEDGPLRSLE